MPSSTQKPSFSHSVQHGQRGSQFRLQAGSQPERPPFNTRITSHRLREGAEARHTPFTMGSKIKRGRTSVFKEVGLSDEEGDCVLNSPTMPCEKDEEDEAVNEEDTQEDPDLIPETSQARNRGLDETEESIDSWKPRQSSFPPKWMSKLGAGKSRPLIRSTSGGPPGASTFTTKFALIFMLVAIVIPVFGAHAGWSGLAESKPVYKRDTSPTNVCRRWAQQVAFLNGTLYLYGGEATTQQGQTENTWNNHFLSMDLTSDFKIDSPPLKGENVPDGPPAVALGYLWHDYDNLYLYGGEFSSSPYVDPAAESLWSYSVKDGTWTEHKNPETSAGNSSEPSGEPVHRAAEGAGLSVPELGLSWYFGGHLDWATTPGWSKQIDRVYLKSLLEFTHPGYVNDGVQGLANTGAGSSGAFRNITQGGVQANDFPERADGALVFVPGWGEQGVLIGLAGGTASQFTPDLGTLDVYDIANSKWFHQKTSGDIPSVRVNLCAVVASAPDASSFQIYMFGGQNLQPYGKQTQYNDMYILTIPSFSWIKVNSTKSTPSPRAGHTCTLQDGQMVLVGGYQSSDAKCEPSGVYVFDASSLQWQDGFTAGKHPADYHPDNSVLAGSYGYSVPKPVQEVVGGDSKGGATVTIPAAGSATGGPFATGKPPIFTVTQGGATQTVTSGPDASVHPSDASNHESSSGHVNGGLVAAGVVAGIASVAALYLGFCAWLYRRQVRAYREHLAASNHYAPNPGLTDDNNPSETFLSPAAAFLGPANSHRSTSATHNSDSTSYHGAGSDWPSPGPDGWVSEPKWAVGSTEGGTPYSGSGTLGRSGDGSGEAIEPQRTHTRESYSSSEELLQGQEPSFFSVVLGPRRALRVVNGIE